MNRQIRKANGFRDLVFEATTGHPLSIGFGIAQKDAKRPDRGKPL